MVSMTCALTILVSHPAEGDATPNPIGAHSMLQVNDPVLHADDVRGGGGDARLGDPPGCGSRSDLHRRVKAAELFGARRGNDAIAALRPSCRCRPDHDSFMDGCLSGVRRSDAHVPVRYRRSSRLSIDDQPDCRSRDPRFAIGRSGMNRISRPSSPVRHSNTRGCCGQHTTPSRTWTPAQTCFSVVSRAPTARTGWRRCSPRQERMLGTHSISPTSMSAGASIPRDRHRVLETMAHGCVGFNGPLWVTEHGYADPAFQYDSAYSGGPRLAGCLPRCLSTHSDRRRRWRGVRNRARQSERAIRV